MSERGARPIYLEVKNLLEEKLAPFEKDVISISEVWAHLRKHQAIRGRPNELVRRLARDYRI